MLSGAGISRVFRAAKAAPWKKASVQPVCSCVLFNLFTHHRLVCLRHLITRMTPHREKRSDGRMSAPTSVLCRTLGGLSFVRLYLQLA